MKGLNLKTIKEKILAKKETLVPKDFTLYWNGEFWKCKKGSLSKLEKELRSVTYFVEDSEDFKQTFLEVTSELSGRELISFAKTHIETKEPPPWQRYYIFSKEFEEQTIAGESKKIVSILVYPKKHLEEMNLPFRSFSAKVFLEFLLSTYAFRHSKESPLNIFVFSEGSRIVSVLSVDDFPYEVIRDTAEEGMEYGQVINVVSYFVGKYGHLKIGKVFICGVNIQESAIGGIETQQVSKEDLIKELPFVSSKYTIKLYDYYVNLAVKVAEILISVGLIAGIGIYGYQDVRLFLTMQNLKKNVADTKEEVIRLKALLRKEEITLKNLERRAENIPKIPLRFHPVKPESLAKLSEIKNFICNTKKKNKDIFEITSFEVEKGGTKLKVKIRGAIKTDMKSKMRELTSKLKKQLKSIRFSPVPPKPPVVRFNVEETI